MTVDSKVKGLVPYIGDLDSRQVSQAVAGYEPYGASEGTGCANCNWYVPTGNACILVAGDVFATGKSKFYLPKVEYKPEPWPVTIVKAESFTDKVKRYAKAMLDGGTKVKTFAVFKDANGSMRFIAIASNNFQDKHKEILSEAAHKEYVDWATASNEYPELWMWHTYGTKFGQLDVVDCVNGFLVGSGLIDKDNETLALAVATQEVGISHGFFGVPNEEGVYEKYRSFEWSVLPVASAANEWTQFNVLEKGLGEMFSPEKKKFFLDAGVPEDKITALEAGTKELSESLKGIGVVSKEAADAAKTEEQSNIQTTMTEQITEIVAGMKQIATAVGAISTQVTELSTQHKTLEAKVTKSDDEKVADALKNSAAAAIVVGGHSPSQSKDNVTTDTTIVQKQTPKTDWLSAQLGGIFTQLPAPPAA